MMLQKPTPPQGRHARRCLIGGKISAHLVPGAVLGAIARRDKITLTHSLTQSINRITALF